jgi:ZIP family zinc transporter
VEIGLEAAFWGAVGGSALLVGAVVGFFVRLPPRAIATIVAFGAGVLAAAISFELMEDAYERGGLAGTAVGFILGALVFTGANFLLARNGARHRKRSGSSAGESMDRAGSGATSLAIGSMLDNIPESVAIGLSLVGGAGVSTVTVIAVFLSNIPEALSSSAGMRLAGHSRRYVLGLWGLAVPACGLFAFAGYEIVSAWDGATIAAITAFAAGAILAMIADTMIPEAFEVAHDFAGLVTAAGFLVAFALSRVSG